MKLLGFLNYDLAMFMAYVIALYSYALLILGALAVVAGREMREVRVWLAIFGFCKGAGGFALFLAALVDRTLPPVFFTGLYLSFVIPAYWAAACFIWEAFGGVAQWKNRLSLAAAWAMALGSGVAVAGEQGADEVFRWLIVLPVGAGFVWALLRRARATASWYLVVMAIGVAGLVLIDFSGREYYTRFQGWTINTLPYYIQREVVLLPSALAASALIFLGGWRWLTALRRTQPMSYWKKRLWWGLPVIFVVITSGGVGLLSWTNVQANGRTTDLFMKRLTAGSLSLRWDKPGEWGEELWRIKKASPDVEGVYMAEAMDAGLVMRLAAAPEGLRLPKHPYVWESEGSRESRFWGPPEAFYAHTMVDSSGAFKLVCYPWAGVPHAWLIYRIEFSVWERVKGPILLQSTLIVGLATVIGVAILIYQLKREEQRELHHDREQAEVVARARGETLAFLSHELRTPLQSVLGYADLLGLAALPEAQRRHLGAIQSQGRLLLHLVNDFLDLAAFEAGRLTIQPRPVRLREVLRECVEAIRPLAEVKGLELRLIIVADVPEGVVSDEARLRQVLGNLLGNAVKFTNRGFVRLTVASGAGADELSFLVQDSGPGISPERQAVLFQPFERANAGMEGAGLGLALTRRLCVAMGGTVELASTPGQGATFTVRLPLRECPPPELATTDVAVPSGEGRALDVLVVDDHPLIRELLVTLLAKLGHRPVAVASGEAALVAFAGGCFEVVLLDLNLAGGIDGIETARRLRTMAAEGADRREVRLIGLSAEVSPVEQARARAEGMETFLTKPVPLAVLAELLPPAASAGAVAGEAAHRVLSEESLRRWRETFAAGIDAAMAELRGHLAGGDWDALGAAIHHLHNGAIAADDAGWQAACGRLAAAASRRHAVEVDAVVTDILSESFIKNSS